MNNIWNAYATATRYTISSISNNTPSVDDNEPSVIYLPALDASFSDLIVRLPLHTWYALLHYIDIYINDFITLYQVGPDYRHRLHDHIFLCIYHFFSPQNPHNCFRKEMNSLKNSDGALPPGKPKITSLVVYCITCI